MTVILNETLLEVKLHTNQMPCGECETVEKTN